MSTDAKPDNIGGFKPSERVTILNNAGDYDGKYGTVVELDHNHGWRVWVRPDGHAARLHMDPDDLERIILERDLPDATPAPLDPSKVKAADRLAAEVAEFLETSIAKANPNLPIVRKMRTALADYQPAPEPEPVDALSDAVHHILALPNYESSHATAHVVEKIRERFVVIDPADVDRAAIRNALMAEPGAAQGTAHALQVMRIIFTELGIEAP